MKGDTKVTLNFLSNFIGDSNGEDGVPHRCY